jgi:hypothetical protein
MAFGVSKWFQAGSAWVEIDLSPLETRSPFLYQLYKSFPLWCFVLVVFRCIILTYMPQVCCFHGNLPLPTYLSWSLQVNGRRDSSTTQVSLYHQCTFSPSHRLWSFNSLSLRLHNPTFILSFYITLPDFSLLARHRNSPLSHLPVEHLCRPEVE